jgi:hypothetical protein
MKAYLIATGSLFALIAAAHVFHTIVEWHHITDVGFILQGPGLGLAAAALSFWAWRLFRISTR